MEYSGDTEHKIEQFGEFKWADIEKAIEDCNASYPDIITTLIVTLNTPYNYDHVRFFILRVPTPDHGNARTDDVINMLGTDHYL